MQRRKKVINAQGKNSPQKLTQSGFDEDFKVAILSLSKLKENIYKELEEDMFKELKTYGNIEIISK